MGILWNVWPWPWASPVLMQQVRQRNYWEDNYRRVKRDLQVQENFSASLYEQNRTLRQQVANLQNENMAAAEKSRRQEQLLLEARNEASRKDKEHRQNLNTLYARLHTLQSGPTSLTDDDVQEGMRRLVFELDSWIKSNFRNSDWPAYITERMEFPRTYPQRRAWIHAHIVQIVDRLIFSPSHCGMSEDPFGGWIAEIENSVKQTSTETAFQNWKMATGTAIEKLTTEQQNGVLAFIIDHIEELFRALAPTVSTSRKQQLRMFLEDCLSLKNALARQPDSFTFFRSPPGADFSAESMTSFGGDGNDGGTVMLSLWPALVKYDGATCVVIDRELVWTTD